MAATYTTASALSRAPLAVTLPWRSPAASGSDVAVIAASTMAPANSGVKRIRFMMSLSFRSVNQALRRWTSEEEFQVQVQRVVGARAATRSIVVGCAAIEARVGGVLGGDLQVLPRPIRDV